jgi:hypothetical protein
LPQMHSAGPTAGAGAAAWLRLGRSCGSRMVAAAVCPPASPMSHPSTHDHWVAQPPARLDEVVPGRVPACGVGCLRCLCTACLASASALWWLAADARRRSAGCGRRPPQYPTSQRQVASLPPHHGTVSVRGGPLMRFLAHIHGCLPLLHFHVALLHQGADCVHAGGVSRVAGALCVAVRGELERALEASNLAGARPRRRPRSSSTQHTAHSTQQTQQHSWACACAVQRCSGPAARRQRGSPRARGYGTCT